MTFKSRFTEMYCIWLLWKRNTYRNSCLRTNSIRWKEHKSLIKYNFVTNNDKSINSELINFIINYARQNNYESLLTSIVSNNIGAKVFYSALGFDILGFEKNAIKIGNTYFDEHWLFMIWLISNTVLYILHFS